MACVDAALAWISTPDEAEADAGIAHEHASSIAIIDATNTTKARRRAVLDRCQSAAPLPCGVPLRVVFLESICDDPSMLESNYNMKLKVRTRGRDRGAGWPIHDSKILIIYEYSLPPPTAHRPPPTAHRPPPTTDDYKDVGKDQESAALADFRDRVKVGGR